MIHYLLDPFEEAKHKHKKKVKIPSFNFFNKFKKDNTKPSIVREEEELKILSERLTKQKLNSEVDKMTETEIETKNKNHEVLKKILEEQKKNNTHLEALNNLLYQVFGTVQVSPPKENDEQGNTIKDN